MLSAVFTSLLGSFSYLFMKASNHALLKHVFVAQLRKVAIENVGAVFREVRLIGAQFITFACGYLLAVKDIPFAIVGFAS